jgi:hypothetical protein
MGPRNGSRRAAMVPEHKNTKPVIPNGFMLRPTPHRLSPAAQRSGSQY